MVCVTLKLRLKVLETVIAAFPAPSCETKEPLMFCYTTTPMSGL